MSDQLASLPIASPNPWLLLWFRPRAAIRAVLLRGGEKMALALFVLWGVCWMAPLFGGFWQLFAPPLADAALAGLIFAICGVVGILSFYAAGYLFTLIMRLFRGAGSMKATQAALAWSTPPAIFGSLPEATGLAPEGSWIAVAINLVSLLFVLWSFVLLIFMLSEVHGIGGGRTFGAVLVAVLVNTALALAIALPFRGFLYQPFYMAAGSMIPTLALGDHFFVSKSAYGYTRYSSPFAPSVFEESSSPRTPRRGDVIMFRVPKMGADLVERVVGLPGDRVQMIAGRLYINGEIVRRRAVEPRERVWMRGRMVVSPTYVESLPGGAEHKIVELDGDYGFLDDTDVFVTPPNALFVLGDNRDNSNDSRLPPEKGGIGFVHLDTLIGRAAFIHEHRVGEQPWARLRLHVEAIDAGLGAATAAGP